MRYLLFLLLIPFDIFSDTLGANPYRFYQQNHLQQQRYWIRKLSDEERYQLDRYFDQKKTSRYYDTNRTTIEMDLFQEAPPSAR